MYYAAKPDSSYENPNASVVTFMDGGKWLIDQRMADEREKFLYVRCIMDE